MKNKNIKILDFKKKSIVELNKSNMISVFGGTAISIADIDTRPNTTKSNNQLETTTTDDTDTGSSKCETNQTQTQTGPKEVFSLNCSMLCQFQP